MEPTLILKCLLILGVANCQLAKYEYAYGFTFTFILIRTFITLPSPTYIPSTSNIRIPQRTPQIIASVAAFAEERLSNTAAVKMNDRVF